MGTKKSVLVDGQGGPLGATIAGANVLERKLLRATIEAIVVERPEPTAADPQHLSLDGGYDNPTGRAAAEEAKYIPHIHKGNEVVKPGDRKPGHRPRRWVVERTFAWLSKCRGILVRYDKKDENYLGLIQFACALYWYRRLDRLGGVNTNQVPT
jgi:putative transposase